MGIVGIRLIYFNVKNDTDGDIHFGIPIFSVEQWVAGTLNITQIWDEICWGYLGYPVVHITFWRVVFISKHENITKFW